MDFLDVQTMIDIILVQGRLCWIFGTNTTQTLDEDRYRYQIERSIKQPSKTLLTEERIHTN